MNSKLNQSNEENEGGTLVVEKTKVRPPKNYKVLLHNDDYTTMEFVIFVLQSIFHKNLEESERIMLEVHQKGIGICGVYTFEVAESKVQKVMELSKIQGHPLVATFEPE
jgi:ATP-dependent Clp protease adaptor protein ClpS